MKKRIALLMALLLSFTVLPQTAFAEDVQLEASTSVSSLMADSDETVDYFIAIPAGSTVASVDITIQFNSELLNVKSFESFYALGMINEDPDSAGQILYTATVMGENPIPAGNLCRITFSAKQGAVGETTISATVTNASDSSAHPLTCIVPPKTITITKTATGITVTPETATVERGQTTTLTATLDPADTTSEVTWSSSDDKIATVDESGVVTGVKAGTATITATVADTEPDLSASCTVTVTNPDITGELTISGNVVFGETLTASLSGYDTGVTYTWYRQDTEDPIATGAQYTIVPADVGKTLTVKATHPDFTGEKTYTTAAVAKAVQNAPDVPVAETVDYNSITLTTVADCEYSMDGETWQTSATFSDLTPGTEYTFYIRKAGTDTHLASPAASAEISTKAYGAQDINFTVKLDDTEVSNDGTHVTLSGATFLTGTEEGTVTITPKDGYYLSGVTVAGATNSANAPTFPTDQAVEYKLTLSNVDTAASIVIDLKTKETPVITFKDDGTVVTSLEKNYSEEYNLTAESTYGTPEIKYYRAADSEHQTPLEQPPVNAGTYVAVAMVEGGVTYEAAEARLNLTINKISAGTATAPQISNITTNGFTYSTANGQKYIVTESATAPDVTAEGWENGTGNPVTLTDKQPGKTYYVHTFIPGDSNHNASGVVHALATTKHTYEISVTPAELNFFARVGSNNTVAGQKITITNTGSGEVQIALSELTNFDVTGLENTALVSGASMELTIAPKSNLDRTSAKIYSDTLTVTATGGTSPVNKTVALKFDVADKETVTFTGFENKTVTYGESYNMETAVPSVTEITPVYEYKDSAGNVVAKPTAAGTYTVTVRVPDTNADYAGEATATLTINKKELTITGIAVADKVYDGAVNAMSQVSGGTLNGVVNGDKVDFNITSANFNSKDVNTARTVTIVAELTGAEDMLANYTLTQPAAVSAKITPKPVTLTVTAEDKVYDGTVNAVVQHSFATGDIVADDASSIVVSVTSPAFADAHAGNGKTVTYTVEITGGMASNYQPAWPESVTANITPKPVTVTFSGEMAQIYDGNAKTAAASVNGKLNADTVPATVLYNGSAEAPTLAGSYVLTATLGNADYKLADAPYTQGEAERTLTIGKGTLVPAAGDVERTIAYLDTAANVYDLAQLFGTPVAGSFTQKSVTDTDNILAQNTLAEGNATIALAAGKTVGQTATITYTFTPSAENTYNPIDLTLRITVGTETVEKVEIIGAPVTIEIGTALDMANISLKVTYKSGRTETFAGTQCTASGYSEELKPENVGTQTLKLEATSQTGKHSATANITVTDVLAGIEMEAQPAKTEYTLGATGIDLAGGKVKATYKSTATKSIDLADSALTLTEVTAAMMRELGEHTVNVSYTEGGVTKQTSFAFTIVSGAAVNPGEGGTGPVIGTDDKFQTDPNDAATVVDNSSVALEITPAKNQPGIDAAIAQEYPALTGSTQGLNLAFMSDGQAVYAQQAVTVQLPYPAGTERADSFMVYLYQNGTLTPVAPTKSANHLSVELPAGFSASDVVLAWTKYVAPETEQESAFDRAQDRFWGDVLRAVAFADAGEVLTVDAGYFDKMPVEIMNAVNVRNVTLVIRWRNGEDIVIGRANALIPEANRLYYPLSYLLRTLTKLSVSGSGNVIFAPQTGDGWEITDWSMGMFVSPLSATQQSGNAALITLMDENGVADLTWLGMLLLVGSLGALCAAWYATNRKKGSEK